MQIDRRLFQVAVSEQHLNGPQVGSGLEQMGGEAMAKGVWMDMLVRETGAFGRMQAGPPKHLSVDRAVGSMPASAGKKPVGRLTIESAPISTQRIKQRWAEHDIAILAPLATSNVDDHALAIDVADL